MSTLRQKLAEVLTNHDGELCNHLGEQCPDKSADAALSAFRQWLEAEASEARKFREEVKADPEVSDYRKGYFAGAEFAIDALLGKIAAAPDALLRATGGE